MQWDAWKMAVFGSTPFSPGCVLHDATQNPAPLDLHLGTWEYKSLHSLQHSQKHGVGRVMSRAWQGFHSGPVTPKKPPNAGWIGPTPGRRRSRSDPAGQTPPLPQKSPVRGQGIWTLSEIPLTSVSEGLGRARHFWPHALTPPPLISAQVRTFGLTNQMLGPSRLCTRRQWKKEKENSIRIFTPLHHFIFCDFKRPLNFNWH